MSGGAASRAKRRKVAGDSGDAPEEDAQPAATSQYTRRHTNLRAREGVPEASQDGVLSGHGNPAPDEYEVEVEELTQKYVQAGNTAGKAPGIRTISQEEVNKLVGLVMRHMLFRTYKDFGAPVRREDLVQIVSNNYKGRYGLASYVIACAQAKFPELFGFEMKELYRARSGRRKEQDVSTAKVYILRSLLPADTRVKYVETAGMANFKGLAILIMSLIQLKGEPLPEDELWHLLSKLGLGKNACFHPTFGSMEQAVQVIVKQRYITKEKIASLEGEIEAVLLAENGLEVLGKDHLHKFIEEAIRGQQGCQRS